MQKLCVFSSIQGVALFSGEPLIGKKIVRTYKSSLSDKEKKDFCVTNQEGKFFFPAVYESPIASLLYKVLPKEPLVEQNITAYYNNKEYILWQGRKRNFDQNGEIENNLPFRLVADITLSPSKKGEFYGIGTLV